MSLTEEPAPWRVLSLVADQTEKILLLLRLSSVICSGNWRSERRGVKFIQAGLATEVEFNNCSTSSTIER
jgi:hypothetical protein